MIGRVSQQSMVSSFIQNAQSREAELQKVQDQLASGYRVNLPSQDPIATINYMDYDSRLHEINTYSELIDNNRNKIQIIDDALGNTTEALQRLRELTVQMSNGVYTKEQRMNAAFEVDQMMRQILANANAKFKGQSLFAGTSITEQAFMPTFQTDPLTGQDFISEVKYMGNHQAQLVEIDRGEMVNVNHAGNQIFWSGNMSILSTRNVAGYTAPVDATIMVDGVRITINAGDNLDTIANKINKSGVSVHAYVQNDGGQSVFNLETTSPHQIVLQDSDGGRVLEELGIIEPSMSPPANYSPAAKVYQKSIFESLVELRKALMSDDIQKLGSTGLGEMDMSLNNVLKYRASLSSVSSRMKSMMERFLNDEVYYTDAKNKAIGTDITQATMEMKMLEFSHNVALSTGARLMPKTLLDFMR